MLDSINWNQDNGGLEVAKITTAITISKYHTLELFQGKNSWLPWDLQDSEQGHLPYY